jgi:ABC-type antimicrobial peptide transport system permease subunit
MRYYIRALKMAFHALRRNVMRSALTTLGIIIGIAAVIAMMEIGQGSASAIKKSIASMGANTLMIMPGTASSGGVTMGTGSVMTLTPQDGDAIRETCPAVVTVAPVVRARCQVVYGNKNWVPMYIYGTTPAFLVVRDWQELDEGEAFTDRDVRNSGKVALIGHTVADQLFGREDPVGKEIRIQNVSFKVAGVLARKGANMMGIDQDDIVLAPWTTIKYRVSATSMQQVNQSTTATATTGATQQVNSLNQLYPGAQSLSVYPQQSATEAADTPQPVRFTNVDQLLAEAATTEQIPAAIRQITDVLHERHHIRDSQADDFAIRDMTEFTKTLGSTSALMTNLLLGVAMTSLVVGGVGIMNIMLVSVTERTREIGLRMAVGARGRHILGQFLMEAVVLCLLGGVAGILFGVLISLGIWRIAHWPIEASPLAVIASVAVSGLTGVVFGLYPAWKASRLDPIEALRYE